MGTSILLSVLASIYTLTTALLRMKRLFSMIWIHCQKDYLLDFEYWRNPNMDPYYQGGANIRKRKVYQVVVAMAMVTCMTLFLQGYAVTKTAMAVYFCDYGVWNLSGCVPGPFFPAPSV